MVPCFVLELRRSMSEDFSNLYSDKYFYKIHFIFVIIRTMISLVGFLKLFAVCITTKTIPTFPIWKYLLLLFKILLCSFFFIFHNASVPHLILSTSLFGCIHLYVHSLIIYSLSSDMKILCYSIPISFLCA